MIDQNEQNHREEMLSQFIDELNREKTPFGDGPSMEADEELCQLFDTVKTVKRLKNIDVPKTPEFKGYAIKRRRRSSLLKYSSLVACIIIAVLAIAGNGSMLSNKKCSTNGIYDEAAHEGSIPETKQADKSKTDKIEKSVGDCSQAMLNGYEVDIKSVYSSSSAAEALLRNLPDYVRVVRVLKLEEVSYTYCVSCSLDGGSFMDIYILPGVKGYAMDYKRKCYSLMEGVVEEDSITDPEIYDRYDKKVNTISWTGENFTIMFAGDMGYGQMEDILEKATGCSLTPLSQQEQENLEKGN